MTHIYMDIRMQRKYTFKRIIYIYNFLSIMVSNNMEKIMQYINNKQNGVTIPPNLLDSPHWPVFMITFCSYRISYNHIVSVFNDVIACRRPLCTLLIALQVKAL